MMKQILKLIESVDPSDCDKLDEIDARVCSYVHKLPLVLPPPQETEVNHLSLRLMERAKWDMGGKPWQLREYTRSRDALKSIRPDGWLVGNIREYASKEFMCGYYRRASKKTDMGIISPDLPTEELAELHAIIQAISYERENA